MTQQNPSPRAAVRAFTGGSTTPAIVTSLAALMANGGTPWDGEDSIIAYSYHAVENRQAWLDLETALAGKADPEAALSAAELLVSGSSQGDPPAPTTGTEGDVLALWGVHVLTDPARRVRVRALSRVASGAEFPAVVLASLAAEVAGLP